MTRYAVLLRGINVGGRNRLPMAAWRERLAADGLGDPQTYLQSGQAFVSTDLAADEVERLVHDGLLAGFGLDLEVMVRDHGQLAAVLAGLPFPQQAAADPTKVTVVFLDGTPDLSGLDPAAFVPDEFVLGDGVVYLHTPDGMGRSKLGAYDWRRAGVRATARNWRTLLALVDKTVLVDTTVPADKSPSSDDTAG